MYATRYAVYLTKEDTSAILLALLNAAIDIKKSGGVDAVRAAASISKLIYEVERQAENMR